MKIAFLVHEFPSLSETFIHNQITGVLERGHDVSIFASGGRRDLNVNKELTQYDLLSYTVYPQIPKNKIFRVARALKIIIRFIATNPLPIIRSLNFLKYGLRAGSLDLLYQVVPFLENGPYDIIHCQFGSLGLEGLCIKQILDGRVKLVTSFRGYDATQAVHCTPHIYDELFGAGDLFLPVSDSLKDRIVEQGCAADKIVVLPSGIRCDKFAYSQKELVPNDSIQLITIARLVEKKGIVYAIEAVARVIESGRLVNYVIIGEGVLGETLEQLIEMRGLKGYVQLVGRKNADEVMKYLQSAHILIAPSITANDGDQEGIPNVIKEAMAMGLPILSTLHSGIPELVKDGVSGFLVKERDVDALAERLTYLIDHPESWSKMGRAGRFYVENYFDINKLNDQLIRLYLETTS